MTHGTWTNGTTTQKKSRGYDMEARDIIQQMALDAMNATQPANLVIGTVKTEKPLTIATEGQTAPLEEPVLLLTEPVIEKKIPILRHKHHINSLSHGDGDGEIVLQGSYPTLDSLYSQGAGGDQTQDIICYEHGKPLPIENGYIILNRRLEKGDKVLMMRVQNGQRFIVLSRVFEFSKGV